MRDALDDLRSAGASLAAIGTGDLAYARRFAAERDLRLPLMVDEGSASYRVVGTRKTRMADLARPRVLMRGARAVAGGSVQGRPGRAPLVLGATHVVRPDGSVPLAWISDDVTDNAPIPEVLAALR